MKIVCDFDGTVTPFDTTDALLERFAAPEWKDVEAIWVAGEITSLECMARQIPMIRASRRELDAFIDTIPLTPGFAEFVAFCRERGWSLCVISDGLDYTIHRVLANHGFADIPVAANHLVFADDGYALTFPRAREGCRFGMCKCDVADVERNEVVMIGDSRSDTCIAGKAAYVYARRGMPMEAYCIENNITYTPYDDFYDVLKGIAPLTTP